MLFNYIMGISYSLNQLFSLLNYCFRLSIHILVGHFYFMTKAFGHILSSFYLILNSPTQVGSFYFRGYPWCFSIYYSLPLANWFFSLSHYIFILNQCTFDRSQFERNLFDLQLFWSKWAIQEFYHLVNQKSFHSLSCF